MRLRMRAACASCGSPRSAQAATNRSATGQRPELTKAPGKFYIWGMELHLSPQQETRVAEAVRSGAYQSPDDVIDRALETLHEQDEWITANRAAIDSRIRTGMDQLDRGEGIAEDDLDAYLTRLKAQAE